MNRGQAKALAWWLVIGIALAGMCVFLLHEVYFK